MTRVLILLPNNDFDPTETAVPWQALRQAGHNVVFATPDGRPGEADAYTLAGDRFGPFRSLYAASTEAISLYRRMTAASAYRSPLRYEDVQTENFVALLVPGGHGPGVKACLDSPLAQSIASEFFDEGKPVGALCHGVLLLARARSRKSGRSPLNGRRTSGLPRWMELSGWLMTRAYLGDHFRTYPTTVEAETRLAVGPEGRFRIGPLWPSRDFAVVDGYYVSARWPGDALRVGRELVAAIEAYRQNRAHEAPAVRA